MSSPSQGSPSFGGEHEDRLPVRQWPPACTHLPSHDAPVTASFDAVQPELPRAQ
jgi:hypothetical protein